MPMPVDVVAIVLDRVAYHKKYPGMQISTEIIGYATSTEKAVELSKFLGPVGLQTAKTLADDEGNVHCITPGFHVHGRLKRIDDVSETEPPEQILRLYTEHPEITMKMCEAHRFWACGEFKTPEDVSRWLEDLQDINVIDTDTATQWGKLIKP